ncbi:hypothetical protein Y1Q_0011007 [Alligator mississippiensis]|uniref:Uncharacterized protein n=1 Tax=Alligator mississippiensis TaxID=8496 RepID=A0A151LY95_ALLMI|nr:hypothetical protein Y1Q_0011007 [Alligator mississippiensis]
MVLVQMDGIPKTARRYVLCQEGKGSQLLTRLAKGKVGHQYGADSSVTEGNQAETLLQDRLCAYADGITYAELNHEGKWSQDSDRNEWGRSLEEKA